MIVTDVNRELERRVLLVAPTTRDGQVTRSLLTKAGLGCVVCEGLGELVRELAAGVGVILLTEDALADREIDALIATLAKQPSWSDVAVVMLMQGSAPSPAASRVLRSLSNVTLLERPAPTRSVISAVQAAVRGRERQYQIRDQFESIRRAEAALKDADRQKDEFLATLAHELRNPLGPIRNSLHLLRLSGTISPSLDPVREIMERQVDHMVRLVDDLLDVSRISRGRIELRKEPVELATIISTAVETAQPLIDAAGHQLALSLPAAPIILDADPVRLAQIIGNLLNNAVKYTKPGGQIWLTARTEGHEAVFSIRDTGLGIPADMLTRVFDMFAQVDRTLTRSQGGLGIGLTLTRSFVEMHGGRIEARSGGLDQGSEFVVHLPMTLQPQQRPVPATPSCSGRTSFSCRRILIVDDTRAASFVLGKLLESLGQRVRMVNDAAAALESVRSEPPDLIISDIAMPHMDGYELARRLRKELGVAALPLVALTGYGQESDKKRAREAGFDYHLVKPVSLEALQDLLATLPGSAEESLGGQGQRRGAPQ